VALVLPGGPESAVAFLAVASAAVAAPLNPAYRRAEFEFFLKDLGARLLITRPGLSTAAEEAAAVLGIPIAACNPSPGASPGRFDLDFGGGAARPSGQPPELPPGAALLLHTSGTTSRPKLVPLTHGNLCASARNMVRALELTEADRCLNLMPLFHIHGLAGGVLASLAAGGSVYCGSGFSAHRFSGWLEESRATWFTAVPTMHQAILLRNPGPGAAAPGPRLRFVRSCSAPLPPSVWRQMESVYSAPVINAYGMTEASHQIAAIPLPPGRSKVGTVGVGGAAEVAIMDAAGELLPPGVEGEVVIRGPVVTPGYAANPEANRAAFLNGWFRTGDRGRLDLEGYLTLTGRIKELINCGGEKISPVEIDEVLLQHPAVAQAIAFAAPHDKLGECVAAAVVLRAGVQTTPAQLRAFVGDRLAKYKTPRKIVFVEEIPQGPTGKPQRIGLAARLGLDGGSVQ